MEPVPKYTGSTTFSSADSGIPHAVSASEHVPGLPVWRYQLRREQQWQTWESPSALYSSFIRLNARPIGFVCSNLLFSDFRRDHSPFHTSTELVDTRVDVLEQIAPRTATLNRTDEAALIRAAQGGNTVAFERLVRNYDHSVLRLAYNLLRSQEDARDIYQETFLRVYKNLDSFRFDCSFHTWLYRIVSNLCLD